MYYLFALVIPPLALLLGWSWMGRVKGAVTLALVSAIGMYSVTVVTAQLHGQMLDHEVHKFDLNQDGVFSKEEQTPKQQAAMDLLINDVGRNLTLFFGVPWALFVSTLTSFAGFTVKRRLTSHSSGPPSASAEF